MNDQIPRCDNPPYVQSNKFMYIKQHLLPNMQNGQTKVLINPNFVKITVVRPHFNKQFLQNQTIHVNPNMLKRNESKPPEPPKETSVPNKAIVTTPTKLIRASSTTNVIVSTRTKLVRVPKQKEQPRNRRVSIHTKYKIIRNTAASKSEQKKEADIRKLYYVKNRFRIDNRSPVKKLTPHKLIRRSSVVNRGLNTMLTTKNVYVKCNSKLNKTQYVSINGILYRRSSKSLISLNKNTKDSKPSSRKISKGQLLTIRGQKYKLDSNHRTLTLISKQNESKSNLKTIYVGGVTFKQKEPNVFVKINTNRKHILLSQARQRSIHTLRNKMKKSNVPCPFYHKFGKCKGKESGTCIRVHNPDQISLCPKFLQGACVNGSCLLSHKVSGEKMPTCKFFLEGRCSKDDCPYLHVKINAKAEICRDFLEGFCRKAAECDKRHEYLCPGFEKTGNCTKSKCQYPHGTVVRKYKFSKIASKLQAQRKHLKASETEIKNHPAHNEKHKAVSDSAENVSEKLNVRYYDESMPSTKEISGVQTEGGEFEIVDLDLDLTDSNFVSSVKRRPKVGELPSFIPFSDEEDS